MVKKAEKTLPTIKRFVIGCSIAVVLLLAGSWILAAVTLKKSISSEIYRYMIALIIVISSSVGTAVTTSGRKDNVIKTGIIFSITLWLLLIAANALLIDGSYQGIGFTLLLIFGGSLSTSLITTQLKNKHHRINSYKMNR